MTHFTEEMSNLKDSLLAMASHAESAVARSMRALVERDDALAQQVVDDDNILDQFEIEVDDIGIHLLAQGPLEAAGAPGVKPSRPRVKVAIDPRLLDAYIGDYQFDTGRVISMRREGDQLWVMLGGNANFPLFAESETVFFMAVLDMTFRFEPAAEGKAVAMFLGVDGKESRLSRTPASASSPTPPLDPLTPPKKAPPSSAPSP